MNSDADMGLTGLGDRLYALWATGFTRRWHMNPAMSCFDDYNCGHQGRCAQLVITLFPDHSIALLRAAVTHDAAESRVGDLSRPFKECGGDLVVAHAALETQVLRAMGFDEHLTLDDADCLQLVDYLDAFLFVQLRNPLEATRNGWPAAREWLLWRSCDLGCRDAVAGILDASQVGDFT
ncbi:hypothetical protein SAMN04488005_1525 [Yoonia tamlensis]|uniref:HD domain-containing protein n=1 Tax=Yoonia tamlensis TaxID=390270 RepID=A0A1I6GEI6_9RHOB|nr:hypothetical protein [Yoonia tamlensis]SFR40596.1 hypothetical protein SAMN04488005_1525 [Yoonia tamlensis]